MRRVRYHVAMGLDGCIADSKGKRRLGIDFATLFNEF